MISSPLSDFKELGSNLQHFCSLEMQQHVYLPTEPTQSGKTRYRLFTVQHIAEMTIMSSNALAFMAALAWSLMEAILFRRKNVKV
jgi:hypothetical protein